MWHRFSYTEDTLVDHGTAFPATNSAKRPLLQVTLRSSANQVQCMALVDSGAPYCLFPLYLMAKLGLRTEDAGRVSGISGYGSSYGQEEDVLFWPLELDITSGLSIRTMVGLTERQDEVGFGLLGQLGFFSEVAQVYFDHNAGWFAIKGI